jgi:hypothetical protein
VRKGPAPKPREVANNLAEIQTFPLAKILRNYKWAYGSVHDRRVGAEAKVQTTGNDPVGEIVVSELKERARRRVQRGARLISEALSNLREAHDLLATAIPDPRPYVNRLPPNTTTRAELEEAKQAQRRREARGDGYGES